MANSYPFVGGNNNNGKFSIAAADVSSTIVIGTGSQRIVSALAVHIVVASGTLSIAVKARSVQPVARKGQDDVAFAAVPYVKHHLNGAAGDGTLVTTAITGTSLITIPATGQEVALDLTQTSGVATVYVTPIEGSP